MILDGLLEVLMEEVKSLHTKLCMESLEDHTHHTRRSKVKKEFVAARHFILNNIIIHAGESHY